MEMQAVHGYGEDDSPAELPPDFGPVTMRWDRSIPGVLKVVVHGIGGDPDAALRRWLYNFELAREAGLQRILVVLELSGPMIPEPQMARMIAAVAGEDVGEFRVAVVQTRLERQHNDELGVLIAMEHGIAARVFADERSALVWLRYGER